MSIFPAHPALRYASAATIILLMSGCASSPPKKSNHDFINSGFNQRPEVTQVFTLDAQKRTQQLQEYLQQSLSVEQAIFVMLAHSPRITAQLAQLGVMDAQLRQAELIANPEFHFATLRPEQGGRWQLDVGLSLPLLDFFTRPLRQQMAEQNIINAQLQLHRQLQTEISHVQHAWYSAVAAQQNYNQQKIMFEATAARHQLASSLFAAGNISEAVFLLYENERQQASRQLVKQQTKAESTKLELGYLMGLNVTDNFTIPVQLPIPKLDDTITRNELVADAMRERTDLKLLQQQETLLTTRRALIAKKYGISNAQVGIAAEREFNGDWNVGPEIAFEIPVFDSGTARFATIDAQRNVAQASIADLRLAIDRDIALAANQFHQARASLYLIGQTEMLFDKRIQLLEREVNYMLNSPFDLLKLKRQSLKLQQDRINTLENYWLARSNLELAVGKVIPPHDHHHHGGGDATEMDHSQMDHSKMDHSQMDHSEMDHSQMDHSEMDHSKMDHSQMKHSDMNHDKPTATPAEETHDHSAHQHEMNTPDKTPKDSAHGAHQHD